MASIGTVNSEARRSAECVGATIKKWWRALDCTCASRWVLTGTWFSVEAALEALKKPTALRASAKYTIP